MLEWKPIPARTIQRFADMTLPDARRLIIDIWTVNKVQGVASLMRDKDYRYPAVVALLKRHTTEDGKIIGDWLLFLSRVKAIPEYKGGNFYVYRNGALIPMLEQAFTKWLMDEKLVIAFQESSS